MPSLYSRRSGLAFFTGLAVLLLLPFSLVAGGQYVFGVRAVDEAGASRVHIHDAVLTTDGARLQDFTLVQEGDIILFRFNI